MQRKPDLSGGYKNFRVIGGRFLVVEEYFWRRYKERLGEILKSTNGVFWISKNGQIKSYNQRK